MNKLVLWQLRICRDRHGNHFDFGKRRGITCSSVPPHHHYYRTDTDNTACVVHVRQVSCIPQSARFGSHMISTTSVRSSWAEGAHFILGTVTEHAQRRRVVFFVFYLQQSLELPQFYERRHLSCLQSSCGYKKSISRVSNLDALRLVISHNSISSTAIFSIFSFR